MNTTTTTSSAVVPVSYASFGARLLALIIDWIVIGVAQSFIIVPMLGLLGLSFMPDLKNADTMDEAESIGMAAGMMAAMGSLWIVSTAISLLYFSIMESSQGQATLGKMALSVKVTDVEGRRISFGKALIRSIGKYISGAILFIGYIMAAFTEKKQALHDLIANTLVVRK